MAVVDDKGKSAALTRLFGRWAIVWVPLFLPLVLLAQRLKGADPTAIFFALVWIFLWICAAAYALFRPNRGIHDRLAGTWVVRR